jgi:hypothetical protein
VTLCFGALLTHNADSIIEDCNMFMIEATEIFKLLPNLVIRELFVKVQAIKENCIFENRTFQAP